MIVDILKTELEQKLQRAKEGFTTLGEGASLFAFPERSMIRGEVIERFQQGLDLFTEVRRTRALYEAAVEKHKRAVPGMKQFHADAIKVARLHFGADPKKMAAFEQKKPSRRRMRGCTGKSGGVEEVVTTVIEDVITTREQVPCESRAPKAPCRAKKAPGRGVKRGCEEAKRCGGRVSRGSERRAK